MSHARSTTGAIVIATLASLIAAPAAATSLTLRRTVASPDPTPGDRYGERVARHAEPPQLVVAAPGASAGRGAAYLVDPTDGTMQAAYTHPTAGAGDALGTAVAALGGYSQSSVNQVVLAAPLADGAGADDGAVQIFDAQTGTLLATLTHPDAIAGIGYGADLGLHGFPDTATDVIVTSRNGGAAYRIDTTTGLVVATYLDPAAAPGFGVAVYVLGDFVHIGSPGDGTGKVHVYDALSGVLLRSFTNPDPTKSGFGRAIAGMGSLLVGAPDADGGVVFQFDASSTTLLQTWPNPAPGVSSRFGATLLTNTWGGYGTLVGAPGTGAEPGRVYAMDEASGLVLETLENPAPTIAGFGAALGTLWGTLAVGAPGDATVSGAAHLFSPCGDGNQDPGEACDDGNTTDGDCCSASCEREGDGNVCEPGTCTGPFTLARTLTSPTGAAGNWFGGALAGIGADLLVSAVGDVSPIGPSAGIVYRVDPTLGTVVQSFTNPTALTFNYFGFAVASDGSRAFVGTPFATVGATENGGVVHVFDGTSGALVQTLTGAPPVANSELGGGLVAAGTDLVVGSLDGDAFVYDTGTWTPRLTIADPTGQSLRSFGWAAAVKDNALFLASYEDGPGRVFAFDRTTGAWLDTIESPTPDTWGFGYALTVVGDRLVVGAPFGGAGTVEIFDALSGAHVQTITNPNPCDKIQFGAALSPAGAKLLVSAPSNALWALDGTAYVYDSATGTLVQTLANPEPAHMGYGVAVADVGGSLAVGAVGDDGTPGAVYVFTACGDGTPTPGEACDDGNTASGDGCSATCQSEAPPTTTSSSTSTTTSSTSTTTTTLPPDPSTIAPPLDETVATSVFDATEFLYTGPEPIQTDVAPGTIVRQRAALVRGAVQDRLGQPLGNVRITVLDHPEFGQTVTRADGRFDLVVNGGGLLTVVYTRDGYFTAQRQAHVGWQDYVALPDVVLVQRDGVANPIDLTQAVPIQVARGSTSIDERGTRQASLLFRQGTGATLVHANGATAPITQLTVRATEFTVGATGPRAMPANLPPQTAYTYAVEFSADEAEAIGARGIEFSQPVVFYLENFIGFPDGGIVPTGYYDRQRGVWVPSTNGRIVKIVSITGGVADLDVTGDGVADSGAALTDLGITTEERTALAGPDLNYAVGQSLWRVPIDHFSLWDCNWGWGPPPGAEFPNQPDPTVEPEGNPPYGGSCQQGSLIHCERQSLGERVPITGTPHAFHYDSDRVADHPVAVRIPLTDDDPPDPTPSHHFLGVELEISMFGKIQESRHFDTDPNQEYTWFWDGLDAQNRPAQGAQIVTIRIGYTYKGVYYLSSGGGGGGFGYNGGGMISSNKELIVTLWQEFRVPLLAWNALGTKLGAWSLDVHHTYDPLSRTLVRGDGTRVGADDIGRMIDTIAGGGIPFFDHSPTAPPQTATKVQLRGQVSGVAAGADGSVYLVEQFLTSSIYRVDPNGIITRVAGGGGPAFSEGAQANAISLVALTDLAVDRDGSLYITDGSFVRKIDPQGIIRTFAGTATGSFDDGVDRLAARFQQITDVKLGPDGSLYVCDSSRHRIRRIDPGGSVRTVAGSGGGAWNGDNIPATSANIWFPARIAPTADGGLYIADTFNHLIRYVDVSGRIHTVAGRVPGTTGCLPGAEEGQPATCAQLSIPQGVAVDGDGTFYFSDSGHHRVRAVGPDGLLQAVAGTGQVNTPLGNGNPGPLGTLNTPLGLTKAPDRSLLIAGNGTKRVQRIGSPMPGFPATNFSIASRDGTELYVFDVRGRHLRTHDTLTGVPTQTFTYDPSGFLTGIADREGNLTTIPRLANGTPTAIVAPGGQTTTLATFPNGTFAAITNPAGESVQFTYQNGGSLLETLRTPRGFVYEFTFDSLFGTLQRDDDPAGGFKTLTPSETFFQSLVAVASAEGRTTTYATEGTLDTAVTRTITEPTGLAHTLRAEPNGSARHERPDGHDTILNTSGDPRFGMQAPVPALLRDVQPSGLIRQIEEIHDTLTLNNDNPLSINTAVTRYVVGGKSYTRTFTGATRTLVDKTPLNRTRTTTLDALGRVTSVAVGGLAPVTFARDPVTHLLTAITEGSGPTARTTVLGYDPKRRLTTITDPLSRTVTLGYDLADRVVSQTFPDTRVVQFEYDASGNVKKVIPPGSPAHPHDFTYTPVELEQGYAPPDVGLPEHDTQFTYNLDRQLTQMLRPDGQTVSFTYEPTGGRLATRTAAGETVTFGYDPVTGQLVALDSTGEQDLTLTHDGSLLTAVTLDGAVDGTAGTTYDHVFRVLGTTVSVPGSPATYPIAFGYDDDSLLTQAGALTLTRHPQHGLVSGTTLGTVADTRTYTPFGELEHYTATTSGTAALELTYTRDALGRIETVTEELLGSAPQTTTYDYDARGRLETVTPPTGPVVSYTYDDNGNRLARELDGVPVEEGTYDAQDRLLTYDGATYTYTAHGELESKTSGTQTTLYDYDALGNLRAVTLPNGTVIEYVIDPANRRVGKRVNGVLTQGFVYEDQLRIAAELDGVGRVRSRFVYGTRTNLPEYMTTYDEAGAVTGTFRLLTDHLGSPRLVVNTSDGTVAQRMDYDELGRVLTDTNPGFQPFGFAGGLYDRDTGLVRFGARDYDAVTGRWTAKEPVGFRGGNPNLYGYSLADPLNLRDPDGNWIIPVAGAALGAGASIYSNWGAYQSGAISGADLAAAAAFAAGTGALAAFPSGVFGSGLAGAAAAFANNVFDQSLTACGSLNFGAAGKAGALGLLGGAAAGFGASVGGQIVAPGPVIGAPLPLPPLADFAAHGGIIGNALGTAFGSSLN